MLTTAGRDPFRGGPALILGVVEDLQLECSTLAGVQRLPNHCNGLSVQKCAQRLLCIQAPLSVGQQQGCTSANAASYTVKHSSKECRSICDDNHLLIRQTSCSKGMFAGTIASSLSLHDSKLPQVAKDAPDSSQAYAMCTLM